MILQDILRVEKRVNGLGIGHGQVVVFQGIDIGLHLSLLLPLLLLLAFVAEDALLLFLDLFLESLVEQLPLLQLICGGKNLLVMPWQCFAQHVDEKDPPRLRHAPVDGLQVPAAKAFLQEVLHLGTDVGLQEVLDGGEQSLPVQFR